MQRLLSYFQSFRVQAASLVDDITRGVVLSKNEYSTGILNSLLLFNLIFRRSGLDIVLQ